MPTRCPLPILIGVTPQRTRPPKLSPALLTAAFFLFSACGGGGDTPKAPSSVQVLLKDGDTLPGGFVVNTVESANMSNDRTVAVIASQPGTPTLNGVFVRDPGGGIEPILLPSDPLPDGISLTTVRNMVISGTNDVSFEAGAELDNDSVFLYSNRRLSLIARTGPDSTPAGFRILGERRIANGGNVVFTDGASPCTIDTSGGGQRLTCTLRIHQGTADGLRQIQVPASLENQTTSNLTVVMDDSGQLVLGLPSRGTQSLLGRVVNGEYASLMSRGDQIGDFGKLLGAKPRVVSARGDVLIDARFDTDGDNTIDKDRVLLLRNDGQVFSVAETGVPAGTKTVLEVRGLAIDDRGRVVFTVTFGDPGDTDGLPSLRIWDSGTTQEIAFEGQGGYGEDEEGNKLTILELEQIRAAGNGDVVFRVALGYFEEGTRRISETRILRWSDAGVDTLLKTGSKIQIGTIVSLAISDLNDGGDLLSIAGVNNRANRALLLLPRN